MIIIPLPLLGKRSEPVASALTGLETATREYEYHLVSPPKCVKMRLKQVDLGWLDRHGLLKYLDCFLGREPEIEVLMCPAYAYPTPPFCSKTCTCPDNSVHMKDNVCNERCVLVGDWFVLVRGAKRVEK